MATTATHYEIVDHRTEETVGGKFSDRISAEDFAETHYGQGGMFWDDERGLLSNSIRTLCVPDYDDGCERVVTLAELVEVPS